MAVSENVRKRRQGRMKELVTHHRKEPSLNLDWDRPSPGKPDDPRMNDPEYVWNHRLHQQWEMPTDSGYGRPDVEDRWREWMAPPTRGQLRGKLLISVILFVLIWGIFQIEHPWANSSQKVVSKALNDPFHFAAVALWYEQTFQGAPSFIPTFGFKKEQASKSWNQDLFYIPITGSIIVPYTTENTGVQIQTESDAAIQSLGTGRVIYVDHNEATGLTVIIQHAHLLKSVYGWVGDSLVKENDWVEGGEQIGTMATNRDDHPALLYFAIKHDDQFINPADVIVLD